MTGWLSVAAHAVPPPGLMRGPSRATLPHNM